MDDKDLIEFLKNLGFTGNALTQDIAKMLELFPANHVIQHQRNYGEDEMRYELKFEHDRQFNGFRLSGLKAIHRASVKIEHKVVNGIDSAKLEATMKRIDWRAWFSNNSNSFELNKNQQLEIENTIKLLDALGYNNADGVTLQEELRFKYWPSNAYEDDGKRRLTMLYENSMSFEASPSGICNANLAYHILSGHLDHLYQQLTGVELEQYPGIDLHDLLIFYMSVDAPDFQIRSQQTEREGMIDYCIPVHRTNKGYEAEKTIVSFTAYPDFIHGVYNGVDSAALENEIKAINWEAENLFDIVEDRAIFHPIVERVNEQLNMLASDEQGCSISDYLRLIYLSNCAVSDVVITPETWNRIEAWPKLKQQFPLDFDAKRIYNLMAGRPVVALPLGEFSTGSGDWFRMQEGSVTIEGMTALKLINGLTRKEIESLVRMLPIDGIPIHQVVNALLSGDRTPVHLNGISGPQKVFLEAYPEDKTLQMFTANGDPINFNFRIEQGWLSTTEKAVKDMTAEKVPLKSQSSAVPLKKKNWRRKI